MDEILIDRGVQLKLELGISFRIELDGVDIPMKSSFCGFVDNYIIITPPSSYQQVQHKLFSGAGMVVRYLYHGTIYAFQTKLFSQIEQPVRLLFLHYPKLIQKSELRREKRAFCHIPTIVTIGEKENRGTITDIAQTGCHFKVRDKRNEFLLQFKVGDQATLHCKFPGMKQMQELRGVVKNVIGGKHEANVGLKFHDNMPDVTQKIITWYVASIEKFVPDQEIKLEMSMDSL